jgi:hypothetical protein
MIPDDENVMIRDQQSLAKISLVGGNYVTFKIGNINDCVIMAAQ